LLFSKDRNKLIYEFEVRAAMGVDSSQQGYLSDSSQKNLLVTVVDAAIDLGIYVIIDWHTSTQDESDANTFFESVYSKNKFHKAP
jgi:aryl-phospho-beta-D-glucosidase BglC (GH1 family)